LEILIFGGGDVKTKPGRSRFFLKARNRNKRNENIDDLIGVNAKREPVGLVDPQDLPKLKIMWQRT